MTADLRDPRASEIDDPSMRLFVAIELNDDVRAALVRAQDSLRPRCDGVRWIPAEQLHLTLKFIGEVPEAEINRLVDAVREVAAGSPGFTMGLTSCGCFPPRGAVRIVWGGADEPSGMLVQLADTVNRKLEPLGVATERQEFSSHVTIGRVREDHSGGRLRSVVEQTKLPPVQQSAPWITLMSSALGPKGPTYTPVAKCKLGLSEPGSDG